MTKPKMHLPVPPCFTVASTAGDLFARELVQGAERSAGAQADGGGNQNHQGGVQRVAPLQVCKGALRDGLHMGLGGRIG